MSRKSPHRRAKTNEDRRLALELKRAIDEIHEEIEFITMFGDEKFRTHYKEKHNKTDEDMKIRYNRGLEQILGLMFTGFVACRLLDDKLGRREYRLEKDKKLREIIEEEVRREAQRSLDALKQLGGEPPHDNKEGSQVPEGEGPGTREDVPDVRPEVQLPGPEGGDDVL